MVASEEEVEIFKWLELPAVMSEGLEAIRKAEIEQLFAGDHRMDAEWQFHLIMVDFDVVNLINRPAAAIGDIIKRLMKAATVYTIEPARRFTVLRPTVHELDLLDQAASFHDAARVCQLLETWAEAAKRERFNSSLDQDRTWRRHFSPRGRN